MRLFLLTSLALRNMKFTSSLAAALLCTSVSALYPIETRGNRFVRNGTEFTVVGIDYQPGGSSAFQVNGQSDVLTDENQCLAMAYVLQTYLPEVNVVRVYSVNPWLNHDKCMSILNGIGVYVLLDVNNPHQALSRTDPASSYNTGYLNNVFGIIDAFKDYPNLFGLFAGNEVINDAKSASVDPAYIRAVQRDMKQYIAKHASRDIPVGYSAADVVSLREPTFEYLQCSISGGDDDSRSDFFGLNSYEWCSGVNDWQTSGYGQMTQTFANSSIPVFLSEYGCNTKTPRTFDEVSEGIYGDAQKSISGGLVYEFTNEANSYGLVDVDGKKMSVRQDLLNLQKQYAKIKLPNTAESDIPTVKPPKCDSKAIKALTKRFYKRDSDSESFNTSFSLPKSPGTDMIKNGGGNKNIGQIQTVDKTETDWTLYDVNGKEISSPKIKIDPSNLEDGGFMKSPTSSAQASSSASPQTTSTKSSKSKGDGAAATVSGGLLAVVFGFVMSII